MQRGERRFATCKRLFPTWPERISFCIACISLVFVQTRGVYIVGSTLSLAVKFRPTRHNNNNNVVHTQRSFVGALPADWRHNGRNCCIIYIWKLFPQSLMTRAEQFVTARAGKNWFCAPRSLLLAPANTKLVACNLHPIWIHFSCRLSWKFLSLSRFNQELFASFRIHLFKWTL